MLSADRCTLRWLLSLLPIAFETAQPYEAAAGPLAAGALELFIAGAVPLRWLLSTLPLGASNHSAGFVVCVDVALVAFYKDISGFCI